MIRQAWCHLLQEEQGARSEQLGAGLWNGDVWGMPGGGTAAQVSCPSAVFNVEPCLLSDKPLQLCYCRLQTLQPQGFQLLCSGHSWKKSCSSCARLTMKLLHVLLNVHRKRCELKGLGMREQMEQQLQQWFLECWLVAEWESSLAGILLPHSSPAAVWAPSTVLPICAK